MWIQIFEIMIISIYLIAIGLLIKSRDYTRIGELINGTIFGVMLEYLNILVFEGYLYHPDFWLQAGTVPNNVPLVIGLAWGLLGITTRAIVDRFEFPTLVSLLFATILAVTFDLFLDVVAVRLEGGFWLWSGLPENWDITNSALYGVPWGNYIGWFFVMFYLGLFNFITRRLDKPTRKWIHIVRILLVPIVSNLALLGTLLLLAFTDLRYVAGWIFSALYVGSMILVGVHFLLSKKLKKPMKPTHSPFSLMFFTMNYLFVLIASIMNGFWAEIPYFLAGCVILALLSIFIDVKSLDLHPIKWAEL
ncbi:MAG: carotenoid biosynthesis protein [Promethearchaeota archaeon]